MLISAALTAYGAALQIPFSIPLVEFEESAQLSKPLVDSESLAASFDVPSLERRAHTLWSCAKASVEEHGHPTRAIGTKGHLKTLEYIYDELEALDYYDVKTEALSTLNGYVKSYWFKHNDEEIDCKPFSLTPGSNGTVEADLFVVADKGCLPQSYQGAEDKVVLVERGQCSFGEKSELAGLWGAAAVIIWDPEAADSKAILTGDLGMPLGHQVATLGVSREWAEKARTGAMGGAKWYLDVDASVYTLDSVNVIAETRGGDHDNVVMLGSHSDSVYEGPGLNDNGSGLNSLLEVAKQLAGFKVKNAVRFAWWTAEEEGLIGSLHYTRNLPPAEAAKIRMFMDYDMMASPNYIFEIYDSDDERDPRGSSAIRDTYIDFYTSRGLNYTLQPFDGRSDYVGFLDIGVPAGGFDAGVEEVKTDEEEQKFGGKAGEAYDKCYHLACDNLENLNYDAWLVNTQLIGWSLGKWARSLDEFPNSNNRKLSSLGWRHPRIATV